MKIIRIALAVSFLILLSSCCYHSNTYPDELKGSKILTDDFLEGNENISIRNDNVDFPDWSIRIFGKRILPKLDDDQKIYVQKLERLRKIYIQQMKIAKLKAKKEAKLKKYEKKIEAINNFPNEVKAGKSNFFLWFYTHDYKKVGYDYEYSEKNLFWGLIKWGKRRT